MTRGLVEVFPIPILSESHAIVIVPTYNERDNLPTLAERVLNQPVAIDMLVVDDGSPDGTGDIADALAKKYPSIHVLHRAKKNGLGRAYCDGFRWALERDYEFIFEMDGDFSHTIVDLQNLIKFKDEFDLVIGSRYIKGGKTEGWSNGRKLLSITANKVAKILLGTKVNDMTSGFRIYSNCLLYTSDAADES